MDERLTRRDLESTTVPQTQNGTSYSVILNLYNFILNLYVLKKSFTFRITI